MKGKHFDTQLFETMSEYGVKTIPALLLKVKHYDDLSEQCQLELEAISRFYSGKSRVVQIRDGCIKFTHIDAPESVYTNNQFHMADMSYDVTKEVYGKFESLVCNGESVAIWPMEFVIKEVG